MVMEIEPLSDALGAKVTNLNLEKEVADSDLILLNEELLSSDLKFNSQCFSFSSIEIIVSGQKTAILLFDFSSSNKTLPSTLLITTYPKASTFSSFAEI